MNNVNAQCLIIKRMRQMTPQRWTVLRLWTTATLNYFLQIAHVTIRKCKVIHPDLRAKQSLGIGNIMFSNLSVINVEVILLCFGSWKVCPAVFITTAMQPQISISLYIRWDSRCNKSILIMLELHRQFLQFILSFSLYASFFLHS